MAPQVPGSSGSGPSVRSTVPSLSPTSYAWGALCLGAGVQNCLWWPLQRVGSPSAPPSPGPIRIVPSALSPLDQQTPHSGPLQAKRQQKLKQTRPTHATSGRWKTRPVSSGTCCKQARDARPLPSAPLPWTLQDPGRAGGSQTRKPEGGDAPGGVPVGPAAPPPWVVAWVVGAPHTPAPALPHFRPHRTQAWTSGTCPSGWPCARG